jgi:hypothetical protein
MLLFNEGATCRKCGGADVHACYFKEGENIGFSERREREMPWVTAPFISRRCERCRHTWRERPLDQATELEVAQRDAEAKKKAEAQPR